MSDSEEREPATGLDIGTMNLVSSHKVGDEIQNKRVRDAFFEVDKEKEDMLDMTDTSYIEYDDSLFVLGDKALDMANIFDGEARRPLSKGLISSEEVDSLEILSYLIENVVGDPVEEEEICYFSVPSEPVDDDQDVIYHKSVFERILSNLGYDPQPANEAMAIIYSECADTSFSGIGLSFGSGMVNAALSYNTMSPLQFSLARGGDWIDEQAAKAMGMTASKMCSIKEEGIDLMDPQNYEEEAIVSYYRALIQYALKNIVSEFNEQEQNLTLPDEFPIVVSGGTSLAEGFLPLFREVFEDEADSFPVEISEIRQAEDPMTAVADGMLVQALQDI